jgi:hypothetical protein
MKFIYVSLLGTGFLFSFSGSNAQCTPRALPFTETFSGTPLAACTPSTGGWKTTSAASGAGWWIPSPSTNYAGGTAPEVEAYGDQANGGISETIRLVSPPIDITSTPSVALSFKHNLYLTNSAATGSNTISINVETSEDSITWTSAYMNGWSATSSLTAVATENKSLTVSGLTGTKLYVRFSISGVMFKVWGWEIDDVNVTSGSATLVNEIDPADVSVFPNPATETIVVNAKGMINASVKLYDLTGKMIYQSRVNAPQTSIDAKELSTGMYFLQIQSEKGIFTKKICKE